MEIHLSDHFDCKKLLRFVLPSIAMMFVTTFYSVADGFFLSNFAGKEAFAAINLIVPIPMAMGTLGCMFGTGGSALVSYLLGKNENGKARDVFTFVTVFMTVVGIVISAAAFVFMKELAYALGATEELVDGCVVYGRVLAAFTPFNMLQNAFQYLLAAAEKPQTGLRISIGAGIVNVAMDFILVYLLRYGTAGAAAATVISWLAGGIAPIIYFMKKRDSELYFCRFHSDFRAIGKVCANGASEMVTNLSASVVAVLFNFQLMRMAGENGVAAYGVIAYVSYFFAAIPSGYAVGITPVIGYHYGAGNKSELNSLLKKSLWIIICASMIITLLSEIFANSAAKIFVSYDEELCKMTASALRAYAISFLFSGVNVFASAFFTGLGNGAVSAAISFLRTFVFQIAAVLLLPLIWEINGVWYAVTTAELLTLAVTAIMFLSQNKKYEYLGEMQN